VLDCSCDRVSIQGQHWWEVRLSGVDHFGNSSRVSIGGKVSALF